MSRKLAIVSVLGYALSLVTAGSAIATNLGGATYSPSWFSQSISNNYTHHWSYDSYTVYTYAKWDSAHRTGVQNWTSQGYRYTQDQRDLNNNLSALIYFGTNFPNPVWDLDDDNGDQKKEEAEVTADSATFPTANYQYSYWQRWSRSIYRYQSGYFTWVYDGDSGNIGHQSQISFWAGEFDTHRYSGTYAYSYYAQSTCNPSTQICPNSVEEAPSASTADEEAAHAHEETGPARMATVDGLQVSLEEDGAETDATIHVPNDLAAHASWNDAIAKTLVASRQPLEAVVTFNRPLNHEELRRLAGPGIQLLTFEAIGTLADGHTYTISGATDFLSLVTDDFATVAADEVGVVAATVSLTTPGSYQRLAKSRDVLLVDLSAEWVKRAIAGDPSLLDGMPSVVDVQLNDVYWSHAGLDH